MPKGKRRGGQLASDQNGDFPAELAAESCRRAEMLVQVTAPGRTAVQAFPDIHRLITELCTIQREHALTNKLLAEGPARVERAQQLLTNMSARGVDCSALGIAKFEDQGLGLVAMRPAESGDVLLEIPRGFLMSTEAALTSPIGDFLRGDPVCAGMPSMALAVFLLHEAGRGKASEWADYINALPASFSNCLYFSPDELQLLRGSPTQERVAADFRRICRQYAFFLLQMERSQASHSLSFARRFTFDDFRWAVGAVMSRNNPVPGKDGVLNQLGLIPLWDLGNHKLGTMTTDFDPEAGLLRFYAMESVKEGEQVYFHYGNRSNADLLIFAGFAVPENPFDRFPVKLGVSNDDPHRSARLDCLMEAGLGVSETFQLIRSSEPIPSAMLAFVRIFVLSGDELSLTDKPAGLEKRAKQFLQTRLRLLMTGLSRGGLSQTKVEGNGESLIATAVHLVVKGEMAVLQASLDWLEKQLAVEGQTE